MRNIARLAAAAVMMLLLAAGLAASAYAAGGDYEKGVAYLRAGRAEDAIKILEPLSASGKDDPYLQYHLGIAYYKAGRLDDAYAAFERTRPLAANVKDSDFRLGVAFSNLGVEYYRAGRFEMAVKCFDKALAEDPEDGDSLYYMGLCRIETGDFKVALAELSRAAQIFGSNASKAAAVQNARGMAFSRMSDNNSAMDSFAKALEYEPNNIEALYYMGQISYKERGYAAASPYFDRIAHAGATDPKTKDALFTTFFNIGVDFQDRGKADSAVEMFERASLIKPEDAETHYYIGYNLMASERYEEASAEFRQALSLDPKLDRAKSQLDVAGKFASDKAAQQAAELMSSGEFYAAVPLYEKAVQLDPASQSASRGLASAREAARKETQRRAAEVRELLANGDFKAARTRAEELARLDPDSSEASGLAAEVSRKSASAVDAGLRKASDAENRGSMGEAASAYAAVLDIDPDNAKARDGLNRANSTVRQARQKASKAMSDGLFLEARSSYRELLRLVPGDEEAAAGLKRAEEAIDTETAKRLKEAKDAFGAEEYNMAAYHSGRALELDPDNQEARELRDRIKSRTRELVIKYVNEGDESLASGLRDKAANSYESALLLDPDNASARAGLEKARHARPAAASEDEIKRLYLLGVEHYTKGELDKAVDAWRQVLKLDPGNEKAASSIKRAQEKMSQTGGK